MMQKTIPAHLVSTYQLLQCAFPQGIEEQDYLPLLSVLHDQMSDRSLAQVIAEYTGKEYHVVLNDVYYIGSIANLLADVTDVTKQKLMRCDYETWLVEK